MNDLLTKNIGYQETKIGSQVKFKFLCAQIKLWATVTHKNIIKEIKKTSVINYLGNLNLMSTYKLNTYVVT